MLAQAAKGARLGLWHWSPTRDKLVLNDVLHDFFCVTPHDVLSMDWLKQHLHPDDRTRFDQTLSAYLEGRRPLLECECRLFRYDGEWIWMRARGQVVSRDEGAMITGVAGTFLDISDKFQETNALTQVAEFLQAIMEHMPIGIAAHSRTSGINVFANARFRRTLGINPEQMATVKSLFTHLFPDPAIRAFWRTAVRAGIESGNPDRLRWTDVPIAPKGGPARMVTVHSILVPDRDMVISTVWDETERKKAEQTVRQSQLYMATATALTHVGYFAFDRDTEEITWTAETYRIFGYEPGAVTPNFNLHQSHVVADDRERVARAANDAIDHRERLDMEYRIQRCDGREAVCRVVADVVVDDQGRPTGLRGAVQDVSLTREAEEERRKLENRLQQARRYESLGLLAGGIAHDFNNLLVAILGHADLAESELPPGNPVQTNLREIILAARRATDLTRQMLAYTGKSHGSKARVHMSELITEMLPDLKASVRGKARVHLHSQSASSLVRVDVAQLRQVVQQLVRNAAESMEGPGGDIRITTGIQTCSAEELRMPYAYEEIPPGTYVFLEVADTGCGMNAQTVERVFDPFFSTKFTGRGLGLAAVLGIVRGHGGALKLESEPGDGTTFRILLPSVVENVKVKPALPDAAPGTKRVLLMGNDASICGLSRRALERAGYAVEMATDLAGASSLIEQSGTASRVIVADSELIEAAEPGHFRGLLSASNGCSVVLCGDAEDAARNGLHVVGRITKPIEGPALLAAVEDAWRYAPAKSSH